MPMTTTTTTTTERQERHDQTQSPRVQGRPQALREVAGGAARIFRQALQPEMLPLLPHSAQIPRDGVRESGTPMATGQGEMETKNARTSETCAHLAQPKTKHQRSALESTVQLMWTPFPSHKG
jgi:hypothetical protein